MGIDISGVMIVGLPADEVWYDEEEFVDLNEFINHHGFDCMSGSSDCDEDEKVVGFEIKDTSLKGDKFDIWSDEVRRLANQFEEITGQIPWLIGMQDVW